MKIRDLLSTRFRYVYNNWCLYIIIANVIVFLLTSFNSRLASYLAMNPINVSHHHMYWQFITYMFVHGSLSHLFFNMLGLYFFGVAVEQSQGIPSVLPAVRCSCRSLLLLCLCEHRLFPHLPAGCIRISLCSASGLCSDLSRLHCVSLRHRPCFCSCADSGLYCA